MLRFRLCFASFTISSACSVDAHAEMPFEKWNKITLFEDKSGNLHMKNLSVHSCRSEQEAIDLLMAGNFIRQVSETPMN